MLSYNSFQPLKGAISSGITNTFISRITRHSSDKVALSKDASSLNKITVMLKDGID